MNDDKRNVIQKDNLTDLSNTLPSLGSPSNSQDDSTTPQNLADNQVIGTGGEVIDLGQTPENTTTK